jgi:cell division septum initiation protein DivIVA
MTTNIETKDQEIERLRARIERLEREQAEQAARCNAAIAAAQERAYWLDRWHVDLNRLMATAWGARVRALMRAARMPIRVVRRLNRRLLNG